MTWILYTRHKLFNSIIKRFHIVEIVLGMTLNCIHIFIVTGSVLYWRVLRPASQRFFIVVFIYESWSYLILQRFLAPIAFLCWCAVKQSINQSSIDLSINQSINQSINHIVKKLHLKFSTRVSSLSKELLRLYLPIALTLTSLLTRLVLRVAAARKIGW